MCLIVTGVTKVTGVTLHQWPLHQWWLHNTLIFGH